MDPLTGLAIAQAVQGVSQAAVRSLSTDSSESTGDFGDTLRSYLPSSVGNNINEEELFAALLHERVASLKGDEAGEKFQEFFEDRQAQLTRGDGYVNVEKAANLAMKDLKNEGIISDAEHKDIKDMAFQAAQLDDNKNALFDGRGSEGDNTVATADIETALNQAQIMMAALDPSVASTSEDAADTTSEDTSTEEQVETTDTGTSETEDTASDSTGGGVITTDDTGDVKVTNYTPTDFTFDGAEGFVFKPESEHGKKLVVLLPPDLAQKVDNLELKDENGNTIERGTSSGYANGGREHFRFDRAGSDYGSDVTVEIKLKNGDIIQYEIPDPSERYD